MEDSKTNLPEKARPRTARESNHGIVESTAVVSRGLAFGFPAYFLGKYITPFFISKKGIKVGNVPRNTGYVFAAIGGIMGAYDASRDARAGKKQLDRLQDRIETLEDEVASTTQDKEPLQDTVEAVTEEKIEPGHDPESIEKPDLHVAADQAQHSPISQSTQHSVA